MEPTDLLIRSLDLYLVFFDFCCICLQILTVTYIEQLLSDLERKMLFNSEINGKYPGTGIIIYIFFSVKSELGVASSIKENMSKSSEHLS
jgi:hypothetical protein